MKYRVKKVYRDNHSNNYTGYFKYAVQVKFKFIPYWITIEYYATEEKALENAFKRSEHNKIIKEFPEPYVRKPWPKATGK